MDSFGKRRVGNVKLPSLSPLGHVVQIGVALAILFISVAFPNTMDDIIRAITGGQPWQQVNRQAVFIPMVLLCLAFGTAVAFGLDYVLGRGAFAPSISAGEAERNG
jgi:hypothetical protein